MEELRKRLKETILIPFELKKALLSKKKWSDKLVWYLEQFFSKYWPLETKISKDIVWTVSRIYIKALKEIEKKARLEESKELKKIEEKIKKL